ncbi:MAG: hypothetical protein WA142_00290 [Rugosibacter sp.]
MPSSVNRLTLLEAELATGNSMAAANDLPDAAVPDTAQALVDQTVMILPHVKTCSSTT